jgi:HK97 family phage major capsid protein
VGPTVLGIMNYAAAAEGSQDENSIGMTDISGTTADQISNTTANLGSATKILDLYYSVPAQYRNSPAFAWVMSSDSEKRVRLLTDAQGRFLWAEGFAGRPNTLLGHPIYASDFMPNGGTDGNRIVVCGDWSQAILAMRQTLSVQLLLERWADLELIAMILRTRFGFAPANLDAFRIGRV